ncbi:hypothetical protein JXA85_04200 [Candidatus Woesearchaeota archaeon]|nr:hypothetical protein [Candidatus Woesearchaeota archaeon]
MNNRLLFIMGIIILLFPNPALGKEYRVAMAEIDRLICKNESSFSYAYRDVVEPPAFNERQFTVFNDSFSRKLRILNGLSYKDGWMRNSDKVVNFILFANHTTYWVEVSDGWYMIQAESESRVLSEEFGGKYSEFVLGTDRIKSAIRKGLADSLGLNCALGQDDNGLLRIFNVYGLETDKLSCDLEADSIYADCSGDDLVQETTTSLWKDYLHHDRRSYHWLSNIILVDMDSMVFNREDTYDHSTRPIMVFSEPRFFVSLKSGQPIYVQHINYLQGIEGFPYVLDELDSEIGSVSNTVKEKYAYLDGISRARRSGDEEKARTLISANEFNYNDISEYITRLGMLQNRAYLMQAPVRNSKENYFEEYYSAMTGTYLLELNSRLELLNERVKILGDLQSLYESFAANILAEFNSKNSWNTSFNRAVLAIMISVGIFLLNLALQSKTRWSNQLDLLKTLLYDLDEVAKDSESYKEFFLMRTLFEYKGASAKFRKTFNSLFSDYVKFVKIKSEDEQLDAVQKKISKDSFISMKITSFVLALRKNGASSSVLKKPDYYVKQINFDFYTKQLDYKLSFLFLFNRFDTRKTKTLIHGLADIIDVIDNRFRKYKESDNHDRMFENIKDLDEKTIELFQSLVAYIPLRWYWRRNKGNMKALETLVRRHDVIVNGRQK